MTFTEWFSYWYLLGLLTCVAMIALELYKGNDFKVEDALITPLCALLGPIVAVIMFAEFIKTFNKVVLIKGRKHARKRTK